MDQLAFAVDLLAAALAAGVTVPEALEAAAEGVRPLREVLAAAATRVRCGGDVRDALGDHPALRVLGRALVRSLEHGAPVGESLGRLSGELRSEAAAQAAERARRAGVHVVAPLVLCFLPAFVLIAVVPVVLGLLGSGALLR